MSINEWMNSSLLPSKADFPSEKVVNRQNPNNDQQQSLSIVDCMLKMESVRNHATVLLAL